MSSSRDEITVRGEFVLRAPPQSSEAEAKTKAGFAEVLRQIREDALTGTFGEFDPSIFNSTASYDGFKERAVDLVKAFDTSTSSAMRAGRAGFELKIASAVFSDQMIGLQKLVHVLVSDLFERRWTSLDGYVEIVDVDLAPLALAFSSRYRTKSHSTNAIRAAFKLADDEPLLAFTIKPRSGLTAQDYEHLTTEVLKGGFHLVEMDTRDLDVAGTGRLELFERLTKLALSLSTSQDVRRFSANLSGPAYAIAEALRRLSDIHKQAKTDVWVVKVDGNLDGLSTIQAIRNSFVNVHSQPIITCYPVLKYGLQRYLGEDTFVRLLAMSGADIIYPGKRPLFPVDSAIDGTQLMASKRHYEKMRQGDFPLLSVAGGVMIGQVHAHMALLGTNVAFFVGGGLALSKKGLRKAAENFKSAVVSARANMVRKSWNKAALDKIFSPLTNVYADGDVVGPQFEYVNPVSLGDQVEFHSDSAGAKR